MKDENIVVPKNGMFALRGDLDGSKTSQSYLQMRQFIGLLIDKEEFLLPMEVMSEIIMIHHVTFVPNAPRYIEGVLNLRGNIVPAVSLRAVMGEEPAPVTPATRIIITKLDGIQAGMVVDGITYVSSLLPQEIEAQSLGGQKRGQAIIACIAKCQDGIKGVLDMTKIYDIISGGKLEVMKLGS